MIDGSENLEDKFRTLWDILDNPTAMPSVNIPDEFACFMRLYILTLQLPSDIARTDASQFDLERGQWTVRPGQKRKPKHIVPLSPYAVSLVERATAIRDNAEGSAIFPACRKPSGLTSTVAMSRRFHRLAMALSWSGFSLMDIRRSGCCLLINSSDLDQDAMIDLVLGRQLRMLGRKFHRVPGMVEKRKTLQAWQACLADITGDARLNETWTARLISDDVSEPPQPGGPSRPA